MKFIEKVKKFQSGGSASNDTWMFKPDEARAAGIVSGSNSHNFLTPNYPEQVEDFDPETHGYLDSIDASTSTFKYPDLNTSEGRKYATKMALRTASGEMPYENVPYQYRTFVGALQNGWKTSSAMNDFGKKFAPVLAGSFLAGPAITYGIAAYSNPVIRTALDVVGSIDGIRNTFTDNGIAKTIRLAKEGDTWGAVKSGVGDVFDIVGTTDLFRLANKFRNVNNAMYAFSAIPSNPINNSVHQNSLKFGLDNQTILSDFREYLGDSGKMYTDKELSNILMSREDALRAIPGRHTVTTPRRVELYGDGVLHGFLNLTEGRVGGTAIDNVKNITHVRGIPVSPELYAGGIYQSLDSGTLGLESGWHLREYDKTRRNINLNEFEGKIVGTGKADTDSFEEFVDRDTQHFIEKIQRDNPDIDLDELDILAYEHEQKLRSEFGVKDDFKYTDEFKDNVEKIQYPYNIDAYMLIAPKKQYPSHSLFPSLESIQNWQKTKTWDFSQFHKQGGKL